MFDPRVVRGNTYALKVPLRYPVQIIQPLADVSIICILLRPLGSNQMDLKNLSQSGAPKFQKLPDLNEPYNPRLARQDQTKTTIEDRVMSERKYLAARSRARKRLSNSTGKDPGVSTFHTFPDSVK